MEDHDICSFTFTLPVDREATRGRRRADGVGGGASSGWWSNGAGGIAPAGAAVLSG